MGKASNRKKLKKLSGDFTTPSSIDSLLRQFVKGLTTYFPVSLSFTECGRGYLPLACLNNCESEVMRRSDATIVHGWTIWEGIHPQTGLRTFIAEFHAVIHDGSQFVDVTPRQDGELEILFVPDPWRKAIKKPPHWNSWSNQVGFVSKGKLVIVAATEPKEMPIEPRMTLRSSFAIK